MCTRCIDRHDEIEFASQCGRVCEVRQFVSERKQRLEWRRRACFLFALPFLQADERYAGHPPQRRQCR